jgi:hypothetical protein
MKGTILQIQKIKISNEDSKSSALESIKMKQDLKADKAGGPVDEYFVTVKSQT